MGSGMDGTDRSSIRPQGAVSAGTAGEWAGRESARAHRPPVCCRAGLQGAGSTGPVRAVADQLHPNEALVEERGPRSGVRTPPGGPARPNQAGGGVAGQSQRAGSTGARNPPGHRPAASPAGEGLPRFLWLPRLRAQPCRSRCPRDRPRLRPRATRGSGAWAARERRCR